MGNTQYQIGRIVEQVGNIAYALNAYTLKGRMTDANAKELRQYTNLISHTILLGAALKQNWDSDRDSLASEAATKIENVILDWEFFRNEPFKNSSGEDLLEQICVDEIVHACKALRL